MVVILNLRLIMFHKCKTKVLTSMFPNYILEFRNTKWHL